MFPDCIAKATASLSPAGISAYIDAARCWAILLWSRSCRWCSTCNVRRTATLLADFCLDPQADAYVADIFGRQYTVIDHIAKLPEKLPELFIALTR